MTFFATRTIKPLPDIPRMSAEEDIVQCTCTCTYKRNKVKGVFSLNQSSVYKTVVLDDYTEVTHKVTVHTSCDVHLYTTMYSNMSDPSEMPLHIIFIHNLAAEP